MKKQVKQERSQEEFYFCCYEKLKQRELSERYFKVILIMSGTAVLSSVNQTITVKTGEFVFVNRGGFSRIRMYPEKKKPFRLLCLNFTDKFLDSYIHDKIHPSGTKARVDAFVPIKSNIMLEALFSSLDTYAVNNIWPDKTMVTLKLQECTHILSLDYPQLLNQMLYKQNGGPLGLEEFMNDNYLYNASLERFATLSGRSLSSFRREFKRMFGTTPNKWLIKKRLEVAYKRIVEDGCSPSGIYLELGFETLSHFSRKFKEQYGIPPSKLH